jgi:hypothetical protein
MAGLGHFLHLSFTGSTTRERSRDRKTCIYISRPLPLRPYLQPLEPYYDLLDFEESVPGRARPSLETSSHSALFTQLPKEIPTGQRK